MYEFRHRCDSCGDWFSVESVDRQRMEEAAAWWLARHARQH